MSAVPARVLARFFDRVRAGDEDACWPWLGGIHSHGYGQLGWNELGRTVVTTAHRVAWTVVFGPIPAAHTVRQKCKNRLCQNPGHLELLTTAKANWDAASNNRDKIFCQKDHEYAGANLILYAGERRCRLCALDARRERQRRAMALNFFYRRLERDMELGSFGASLDSFVDVEVSVA